MSDPNLPAPTPAPDEHAQMRARMAAMAEGLLKWDRAATLAMHELLVGLLRSNCEVGWNKFTTPNGRNCIIIIGVGDEAVGPLTDAAYYLTHPEEQKKIDPEDDPDFWKKK